MSKKHHGGPAPIPPGNRAQTGNPATKDEELEGVKSEIASQQEEPSNRIGDYTGKGEHSIQEPGGKNGANH